MCKITYNKVEESVQNIKTTNKTQKAFKNYTTYAANQCVKLNFWGSTQGIGHWNLSSTNFK